MFVKECREVLSKEKNGEMSLKRFPEEFYRVNKRQLVCADYGHKKLASMLENAPGIEARFAVVTEFHMSISTT